jgi:hypothetical protein
MIEMGRLRWYVEAEYASWRKWTDDMERATASLIAETRRRIEELPR